MEEEPLRWLGTKPLVTKRDPFPHMSACCPVTGAEKRDVLRGRGQGDKDGLRGRVTALRGL